MIQRNIAIDILKFIAVFMVMNSHMAICYPKYSILSTGGAIGDALFFFASGFTLFLGGNQRFDNWYKRRINRIYPSILATAIFAYVLWGFSENIGDILLGKRYWFIGCILVYYFFIYPIKVYKDGKYAQVCLLLGGAICIIAYFCFFNTGHSFYGGGLFRCLAFFLIMLQGAIMGKQMHSYSYKHYHVLMLVASVALWYTLFYIGQKSWILLFSFIPLFGITRYLYLVCCAPVFKKFYDNFYLGNVLYVISQLCLEVYLIQKFVFTDSLNNLFPLNIPIIMFCVILFAYLIKLFSNFISQTFKSEPYEWRKMLLYKNN